ncbi:antitoxin YezG family protein [Bacillus safensis]|uniref:antitoxin YezG family protein n=1 Tax=Bacillus safensis TaxID=561879 RepID=UPI00204227D4|nr:antitoxin YezG family protein [Bacillus safensis]MCM2988290.1 antitoxin YezG family protein [Bacillus safensis]
MDNIEKKYEEIAEILNTMIPAKWDKVWTYAEIVDDSLEAIFYFNTPDENLIYGHKIPKKYNVSELIYDELLVDLLHTFKDLKEEYIKNNLGAWTTATLALEKSGKFSIDYGYEDIYSIGLNGVQRKAVWKYETFGFLPEDEEDKEAVLNYVKNKEENN